jgi:hypothetical protein
MNWNQIACFLKTAMGNIRMQLLKPKNQRQNLILPKHNKVPQSNILINLDAYEQLVVLRKNSSKNVHH